MSEENKSPKPREWRINQMGSNDSSDQIYGPAITDGNDIHVIEKKFYDEALAEIERLNAEIARKRIEHAGAGA